MKHEGGGENSSLDNSISRTFYSNLAETYWEEAQRFVPGYPALISSIWIELNEVEAGGHFADLGCGPGYVSDHPLMYLYAEKVYGVDKEPAMIAAAKIEHADLHAFVPVLQDALDFKPDAPLDAAFANLMMHNLSDVEKHVVLKNAFEYLKPGAKFLWGDLVKFEDSERQRREVERRRHHALAYGADPKLVSLNFTKEADEDQPITTAQMFEMLAHAGFVNIQTVWEEGAFALLSGRKPA